MIVTNTKGIIPPLITPLTTQHSLDQNGLVQLIEHVIAGGINGIFLLGSTGEGASLTNEVKKHVIKTGVKSASGRVPVYVNISSTSYLDAIQLAQFASLSDADYAVLAPPYYFKMKQSELIGYFSGVADQSPIPVLLYNAPQYTKSKIESATVWKLSSHKNIVGIKDSSGSMEYIHQLIRERGNEHFPILVGPELLLGECVILGCDGGVCGGANLFPGLYSKIYQASLKRDMEEVNIYQKLLERIHSEIYHLIDSPMSIQIGLKYILSPKGLCSPQMALPVYEELTEEQKLSLNNLEKDFSRLGY